MKALSRTVTPLARCVLARTLPAVYDREMNNVRLFVSGILFASLVACGSAPTPAEPSASEDDTEEETDQQPVAPAPVQTSKPMSGYSIAE